MKIAYLILAHNKPEQLKRLINKLNCDNVLFIIHIDEKVKGEEYKKFLSIQNNNSNIYFVEKRIKVYWGHFSIVKATLLCMNKLRDMNIEYNYALLLSGSDYPIKSNSFVFDFLQKTDKKGFVHGGEMQWVISNKKIPWIKYSYEGLGRIRYYHFCKFAKYFSIFNHFILNSFIKEFLLRRNWLFTDIPYCGSQWWCLDKELIEYVLDFCRDNVKFVNYFKYTFVPDEMFFHTILFNSHYKDYIEKRSLTLTIWTQDSGSHPSTLTSKNLPELISTKELFARKFDEDVDSGILDKLDSL